MTSQTQRLVGDDGGPLPAAAVEDTWVVERASASPMAPGSYDDAVSAPVDVTAPAGLALGLQGLQRWFAATVMHPDSVIEGARSGAVDVGAPAQTKIEHIITPSARLSAQARIELYRFSYFARLVECLVDDYPSIHHLLGHDAFEQLARSYINACPSTGPNLNGFGKGFGAFVQGLPDSQPHKELVVELARLEWAMVEIIHAESAASSFGDLSTLPPDAGARLRFTQAPTLRFLEFAYPVNRYLQDVREDREPKPPAPSWSATAIYRQNWRLWRMDFTAPMAQVLRGLLEGKTLGAALAILETLPSSSLEGDVTAWFRSWVSAGFFSSFEVD